MDSRRARLTARLRQAPASLGLVALHAAVLLGVSLTLGDIADLDVAVRAGALERSLVWSGQWWRLLTATLLHGGWAGGWLHLAVNFWFGFGWMALVEGALGRRRFLALWLLSAVAGSAASLLAWDQTSVGASGAIFGMVGAVLALHRRMKGAWRPFLTDRSVVQVAVSLAIYLAVTLGSHMAVDHAAHAGGLAVGWAGAWVASSRPPRWRGWAALTSVVLLAAVAACWPRAESTAWRRYRDQIDLLDRIGDALRQHETGKAASLLQEAERAGVPGEPLAQLEAMLAIQQGRLEDARRLLAPLKSSTSRPLRLYAQGADAILSYDLAETPTQKESAYLAIQAACAEGHAPSCEAARRIRDGPSGP